MGNATHTPGPYIVFPREPDIEGFTVETSPDQLPVAIVPKNRRPNAEALANANLFAAAPEMLEALKIAEDSLAAMFRVIKSTSGIGGDCPPALRFVLAAIAKAEGRS